MKVKAKRIVGVFLIFIFMFGVAQLFMPVTEAQQTNLVIDQAYWLSLANNAWKYFQPGVGIDPTTGLHSAVLGYNYFTDWDLGVYIQAAIDANQLGILSNDGTWGANVRFNKILTFLETRKLTSNGLPYQWYQCADGNPMTTNSEQNAADSGELLVTLNNLKVLKPNLADRINTIVYNRTNYTQLKQAVDGLKNSKNIYDYYVANGFAGFWPSRFSTLANSILDNIVSAPTVSTYGISLPISKINCEPLLLSVFNLDPNAKLDSLANLVYLAHEARYKATGKFVAFSEGNTGFSNNPYVYEWVVKEDGSTWTVDNGETNSGIAPIIYFKAAVGFLAMHNTTFTQNMYSYIESRFNNPSSGYYEGVDEDGRIDLITSDKTNSMILGAALYATYNLQNPTSSPTPIPGIPTSSPTPIPGIPTSSPTPIPGIPTSSPTPIPGIPTSSPTATLAPGMSASPSPTNNTLTSTTPSPSSSAGPIVTNQLTNWSVLLIIAVIILILIARFTISGLSRRYRYKRI